MRVDPKKYNDLSYFNSLVGKYVRVTYGDDSGGAGVLAEVERSAGQNTLCLIVDYGYGFDLLPDARVEVTDAPP